MNLRPDAKTLITTMIDPVEEEEDEDMEEEDEAQPVQQVHEVTLTAGIQSVIDSTMGDTTEDFTLKYFPPNQEASRREWKKKMPPH